MAEHKAIQNPDDYSDKDYQKFHDYKYWAEYRMKELKKQIAIKEKTVEQIQGSIKTDKYKDIDTDADFKDEIPF